MKVYLDNDVVSAIAKDDTPAESAALYRLLAAYGEKKVDLVTSQVTLDEIKAYRDRELSGKIRSVYRRLEEIPLVRWDQLSGVNSYGDKHTWINTPMIQNDPIYNTLLARGVKPVDAHHVFVAAKNACDVFLTCDRGILHRSPDIGELCRLVVEKPSGFVASQGWLA